MTSIILEMTSGNRPWLIAFDTVSRRRPIILANSDTDLFSVMSQVLAARLNFSLLQTLIGVE
jgi:hypothetical protein